VLTHKKIGFIGGGNMAEAMLKGLLSASFIDAKNLMASDVSEERLDKLKKEYKIKVTQDNRELVQKNNIIILAIKPQVMKEVLTHIHEEVDGDKLVISVMAGPTISAIEHLLNPEADKKVGVVRTMPNTPALVQEGVTALAAGDHVSKNDLRVAHRIFEAIGIQDVVAKAIGSNNPHSMVNATFDALQQMQSPRQVAARRGKKVSDIIVNRESARSNAEQAVSGAEDTE